MSKRPFNFIVHEKKQINEQEAREMEKDILDCLMNPAIIRIETNSLAIVKEDDRVIILDRVNNRKQIVRADDVRRLNLEIRGIVNTIGQKEEVAVLIDQPVAEVIIEKYMAEKQIVTIDNGNYRYTINKLGDGSLQIVSVDQKEKLTPEERNEAVTEFIVVYREEISHLPRRIFDFSFKDECRIATYEMRINESTGEQQSARVCEETVEY